MRNVGESRIGVFDANLIESSLARPKHAAVYESADIIRQAAHFCFGFIKNHPWNGGNKRTATYLTKEFLSLNNYEFVSSIEDTIEMVLAVEADRWKVDEIEKWLRERVKKIEN
jgi:death on curing protein